ncbi:MAG: RNA-protein complex protein Nop10 [Nitrososphaerales archaeon]
MLKLLRKCKNCKKYTLELKCPTCGAETFSPHPPKFSPDDKYARLRIKDRYLSSS